MTAATRWRTLLALVTICLVCAQAPAAPTDQDTALSAYLSGNGLLNRDTGEYMPFTVKKGDRVIFSSYAGTEIKIDDNDLIMMTEDDILGVIE